MLDDVGLVVFDAFEPVGDVEPVTYFLGSRLDELELGGVGEPAGDQCCRVVGSGAVADAILELVSSQSR